MIPEHALFGWMVLFAFIGFFRTGSFLRGAVYGLVSPLLLYVIVAGGIVIAILMFPVLIFLFSIFT